jgi:hypothetical protein
MHQAIAVFLLSLALTGVAASFVTALRLDLLRPVIWIAIFAAGFVASAASALVITTRHAGTGFTTSHGWPKSFYFLHVSETGGESHGWSFLYFLGNSLACIGTVLILWAGWRLLRR